MRRHRFIVPVDFSPEEIVLTDKNLIHQMRQVLKLAVGEEVVLADGAGREAVCDIVEVADHQIALTVVERHQVKHNSSHIVTLYLAILKRDNFEWAVQKATEVGVGEVVPLITDRTIKTRLQRTRLEKIIKEAAEQCGRATVPALREPIKIDEALTGESGTIFFDMSATRVMEKDASGEPVSLFIGPEGGWSERERNLAKEKGCLVRSLGDTVLRAETAAVVASYVVCNL